MQHDFKVGDIVRLNSGTSPILVTLVNGDLVYGVYRSGSPLALDSYRFKKYTGEFTVACVRSLRNVIKQHTYKHRARLLLTLDRYESNLMRNQLFQTKPNSPAEGKQTGEGQMTKQLYTWKNGDKELFGHKLSVASSGKWVMETKGKDADVVTVDKELVEKVMPYTVSCTYLGTGKEYSFFAEAGSVEVDDVVMHPHYSTPMIVTKLDTKSERASAWLEGPVIKPSKVLKSGE